MIPEFHKGQRLGEPMRQQLNALVRRANALEQLTGDGLVTVTDGPTGKSIGLNLELLASRLPRVGAGTGIAIQNHSNVAGRIPRRLYSFSQVWEMNAIISVSTYIPLELGIGSHTHLTGICMPCFGKITTFSVFADEDAGHGAGAASLRLYNITQAAAAPTNFQLLNVSDLDSKQETMFRTADSMPVLTNDLVRLEAAFASASGRAHMHFNTTFTVEETTAYVASGTLIPDATGVYVRNNDTDLVTVPYCERVDGAFWLAQISSFWAITETLPEVTNYWKGPAVAADPASATYAPQGNVTGTLTLAVQPD